MVEESRGLLPHGDLVAADMDGCAVGTEYCYPYLILQCDKCHNNFIWMTLTMAVCYLNFLHFQMSISNGIFNLTNDLLIEHIKYFNSDFCECRRQTFCELKGLHLFIFRA